MLDVEHKLENNSAATHIFFPSVQKCVDQKKKTREINLNGMDYPTTYIFFAVLEWSISNRSHSQETKQSK